MTIPASLVRAIRVLSTPRDPLFAHDFDPVSTHERIAYSGEHVCASHTGSNRPARAGGVRICNEFASLVSPLVPRHAGCSHAQSLLQDDRGSHNRGFCTGGPERVLWGSALCASCNSAGARVASSRQCRSSHILTGSLSRSTPSNRRPFGPSAKSVSQAVRLRAQWFNHNR